MKLALVRLYVFSHLSTSALLTKLDLATNSWWQRWQRYCLSRQQENCLHQMCNQMFALVSFWNAAFFFRGAPCSLFSQMIPTPYISMSVSLSRSGNVMKKLPIATVDPLVRSHFSIIPRTTRTLLNPVPDKFVSFSQYGSAWRRTHLTSINTKV